MDQQKHKSSRAKEKEKQVEEEIKKDENFEFLPIHNNPPYWDFPYAEENYGLDYQEISQKGFDFFFTTKFLKELSDLRNAFIAKEITKLRFAAHTYKGTLKYL